MYVGCWMLVSGLIVKALRSGSVLAGNVKYLKRLRKPCRLRLEVVAPLVQHPSYELPRFYLLSVVKHRGWSSPNVLSHQPAHFAAKAI